MLDLPANYGWATVVALALTLIATAYAHRRAGDADLKAMRRAMLKDLEDAEDALNEAIHADPYSVDRHILAARRVRDIQARLDALALG